MLVACEFSGVVREAFRKRGHDAWSCDLLPTEIPGQHFQMDVGAAPVWGNQWDLLIAHPPCTHLAVSGARWFKIRQPNQDDAIRFFYVACGPADTTNCCRESYWDYVNTVSQAGPNYPAVDVWAWRDEGDLPVAERIAQTDANEHRGGQGSASASCFPRAKQMERT